MQAYGDTGVRDFFATHRITNNEIYAKTGQGGKGGGPPDYISAWREVLVALRTLATFLTVGDYVGRLARFVRGRMGWMPPSTLRHNHPIPVFSKVAERDRWVLADLAKEIGETTDEARHLLGYLGYKYDRHIGIFTKTALTDEKLKRLASATYPAHVPAKGTFRARFRRN